MPIELIASVLLFLVVMSVAVVAMTPNTSLTRVSWPAGRPVRGLQDRAPHTR